MEMKNNVQKIDRIKPRKVESLKTETQEWQKAL